MRFLSVAQNLNIAMWIECVYGFERLVRINFFFLFIKYIFSDTRCASGFDFYKRFRFREGCV